MAGPAEVPTAGGNTAVAVEACERPAAAAAAAQTRSDVLAYSAPAAAALLLLLRLAGRRTLAAGALYPMHSALQRPPCCHCTSRYCQTVECYTPSYSKFNDYLLTFDFLFFLIIITCVSQELACDMFEF